VLHELGDDAMHQLIGLLKPEGTILFVDWDAATDRPVGPPRDHTYTAADATRRVETFGLKVETLDALPYHFVLRAQVA
jgi:hypothetical protein